MRDGLLRAVLILFVCALAVCVLFGWALCTAFGADAKGELSRSVAQPASLCRVVVTAVHDGDTFDCDIRLPFAVTLRGQSIRIRDFDAWESTRARRTVGEITSAELARGKAAAADLARLLSTADAVYVVGEDRPRFTYERLLAEVWIDPPDVVEAVAGASAATRLVNVGQWMREHGHERPPKPPTAKGLHQKAPAQPAAKAAGKRVSVVRRNDDRLLPDPSVYRFAAQAARAR